MIKKLGMIISSLALVVGLAGCSSSTSSKEYYHAIGDTAKNGWTYFVAFEMENDKITSFTFDAVQLKEQEGRTKAELSKAGEYDLAPGNSGEWYAQAKLIEDYVVANNGLDGVKFDDKGASDAISGATIKFGEAADLIEKALKNGPVEKGSMTDGVYFGEVAAQEEGKYSYQVAYFVNFGHILGVHLDGVSQKDGEDVFKTDMAAAGEYVLAPSATAPILDQLATIEAFIIKNQGFDVKVDDSGKTDAISGATISVDGFMEAFNNAKLQK